MRSIEELNQIKKEIAEAMDSGKYKVVGLDLFNSLDDFKLNEFTVDEYDYTKELYENYLHMLQKIDKKTLTLYLNLIKSADVIDNQRLEQEDSFLLALYRQIQKEYAVDYLLDTTKESKITPEILKQTHGILLSGTNSEKTDTYHFRKDNSKFVGNFNGGKRNIEYFPIRFDEIDEAASILCEHQENYEYSDHDDMVKPIILHGLIATLQMFDDGNTRLGRLLQHVSLYNETKKDSSLHFENPTMYATRTYFPLRGDYRKHITNLAINPDSDAWNSWIKFNLRRIQDQIYANDEKVKILLKR